ncbi:MAG TPA: carbohydrate kinase family protein [Gaiellaceae bacterium]|nr:carbohydrate kinase family protein [Gaiellaceae bacterium]
MSAAASVRIVVLGYLNVDHVLGLNRELEPGVTALVERRHTPSGGRLGGCASYIATGLAASGAAVAVVSSVGRDAEAAVVESSLAAAGVETSGVEQREAQRTGVTYLPYAPTHASYCIYDPGGPLPERLTEAQRELCRRAGWLVAAVGAPAPCAEALAVAPAQASVFWAVKGDPASFPAPLARALAERAAVIVYSAAERPFLEQQLGADWRRDLARPDALVVETHGHEGARYWDGGREGRIRPEAAIAAWDTIGAGDRFCAGLLAARIGGADAEAAVRAGAETAAALLRERADASPARGLAHDDEGDDEGRMNTYAGTRVVPGRNA